MKRFALSSAALVLLLVLSVGSVSAHASLVKADPAPGAVLVQPPAQVQLWFDEQVDAQFSEVQLYDSSHKAVQTGPLQMAPGDSKSLILPVKEQPGTGTFSVVWKAFSATDGHITRGVFAFSVGQVTGPVVNSGAGGAGASEVTPVDAFVRGLDLLALLALVGGFIFRLFLLDRSLEFVGARTAELANGRIERRWQRLTLVALGLALAGDFLSLILQANLIAEQVSLQSLADVLFDTRYGALWVVRVFILIVIGTLLLARTRRTLFLVPLTSLIVFVGLYLVANSLSITKGLFLGKLFDTTGLTPTQAIYLYAHHLGLLAPFVFYFALAGFQRFKLRGLLPVIGVLALVTHSLGSHGAGVQGDFSLAVLSDWVHLTAVSIWVGGLVYFAFLLPSVWRALDPTVRGRWLARLVAQFSILGLTATPIIALTGIYNSYLELPSLAALVQTLYGDTLTLKVALFVVMLLLGALNLLLIRPRLSRHSTFPEASARLFPRLRITLGAEVILGLAAIVLAGLLTLEPPARAQGIPSGPAVAQNASIVLRGDAAPDAHVQLVIGPNPAAPTQFDARVVDASGQPTPNILRVIFSFSLLDSDTGVQNMIAEPAADGHYILKGSPLAIDGMWLIHVIVRRKGVEDVSVDLPYYIPPTGGATHADNAQARTLLATSDAQMNQLMSLRSTQYLNDGENDEQVTTFEYHAPDQMRLTIEGQGSSIAIGPIQYYQEKDGTWTSQGRAQPFVFPAFDLSKQAQWVALGRTMNAADGEPAQIVRFAIPNASGTNGIQYAYWVSTRDQRLLQLAMVTDAHYMLQYYQDFDAPNIAINAPPVPAGTPTALPTPNASAAAPLTSPRRPGGIITGDLEADGGLVLLIAGIALAFISSGRRFSRNVQLTTIVVAAACVVAGLGLFIDALNSITYAASHVTVNAQLAESGRASYQEYCLACHGPEGKGDGPAGAALPVKPFDLTTHVLLHDEFYLHDVILNGRGYMPAFGDRLSQDQIVAVIAYIRQLALDAQARNPSPGFTPGQ